MSVLDEIAAERRRQIEVEHWSHQHDDAYRHGELAKAAAGYAMHASGFADLVLASAAKAVPRCYVPRAWPWASAWFKPKTPRHDLIRAGALIVAEIERLDRASAATPSR